MAKYKLRVNEKILVDLESIQGFDGTKKDGNDITNILNLTKFTTCFNNQAELVNALKSMGLIPDIEITKVEIVKQYGNKKIGYGYDTIDTPVLYAEAYNYLHRKFAAGLVYNNKYNPKFMEKFCNKCEKQLNVIARNAGETKSIRYSRTDIERVLVLSRAVNRNLDDELEDRVRSLFDFALKYRSDKTVDDRVKVDFAAWCMKMQRTLNGLNLELNDTELNEAIRLMEEDNVYIGYQSLLSTIPVYSEKYPGHQVTLDEFDAENYQTEGQLTLDDEEAYQPAGDTNLERADYLRFLKTLKSEIQKKAVENDMENIESKSRRM